MHSFNVPGLSLWIPSKERRARRAAEKVGAADGRHEIERDEAAAVGERLRQEGAQGDGTFEILSDGDGRAGERGAFAARTAAVVGAVVLRGADGQKVIDRNDVGEVAVPA